MVCIENVGGNLLIISNQLINFKFDSSNFANITSLKGRISKVAISPKNMMKFVRKLVHLLVIRNKLAKLQDACSNTVQDILLIKLKCQIYIL